MKFNVCVMSWITAIWLGLAGLCSAGAFVKIPPASTARGYLARLLLNENPFPGERGFVSVEDSKAGMRQVLWVLHGRMHCVPAGYTQSQICSSRSKDILEVITAKRQCEGFFMNENGKPAMAPRVEKRLN
jgi:hypothetical protein